MVEIHFEGRRYALAPGETVLDGMLRQGAQVPYHCRVGGCQTCLLVCTRGRPPEEAVAGLAPGLRSRGYFFTCICVPSEDLVVQRDPLDPTGHAGQGESP